MSDVFNDLDIHWQGKTYTFRPTNRVLRKIEGELAPSSLTDIINRMNSGKPPISETAFVVAKFLEAAGADHEVSDEDLVYQEIMTDFAENNGLGFVELCKTIIMAISPSEYAGKKPSAATGECKPKAASKAKGPKRK